MRSNTIVAVIVVAVLAFGTVFPQSTADLTQKESLFMKQTVEKYGKPNPKAPQELSRFAFLIGTWRCEVNLKQEDGTWDNKSFTATWEGRYTLDGYAIADEFRMMTREGELVVLGVNLRAYDAQKKSWNMKWLHALGGTWVDLGPEELGGVKADDKTVSYMMKEPLAAHIFTRATYTDFSTGHFTWRGERSNDGKQWEEFLVIEAYRNEH